MASHQNHLKNLITNHQRRLQILKEQKALHGIKASPEILIEIEDIETEITTLKAQLSPPFVKTTPQVSVPATSPDPPFPSNNPFVYGGAIPPNLFYGRDNILPAIIQRIGGRTAQSISIVGEQRMGKTSLLHYIKARINQLSPPDLKPLVIYLDLTKAYSRTLNGLMHALRRELTRTWREPWSKDQDNDLGAFDFALEDLQAAGIRLILCLDEVKNLTQRAAEFNDVLEDWRACGSMGQMVIITASTHPLADLCASGRLTSPFYNIFEQRWLGLLAPSEWQALVTNHMTTTPDDLTFIDQVAGGQPFFTQMAAAYLWQAKINNSLDYDQLYQDLQAQLKPHLKHLWAKLTLAEQTALHHLSQPNSPQPDSRILAALTRRGIIQNNQPFSQLFTEMIAGNHLT